MLFGLSTILAFAAAGSAMTIPKSYGKRAVSISVTPHDQFSSSIGVLGCKINTNRVAYWPGMPDCNNVCLKLSANGNEVFLLRVDSSGSAHDISYGAWNQLMTGKSARVDPQYGGGIDAVYEYVDPSNCMHLIHEKNNKLAFQAANSINFISSCGADTWVGQNHALYNIGNSACTVGFDEECTMPPPSEGNQPTCPHTLGLTDPLTSDPRVENIVYGTGELAVATQ